MSQRGRPCVATCCCWPPLALIRSLNCSSAAATTGPDSAHDQAAVIDSRIRGRQRGRHRGPAAVAAGHPDRIAADPNWGPYLDARSDLVAQLADQVRVNTAGEAPAWAAVPARSRSGRVDRRRAGVARRHPGRPQRPATHRATPARLRRPNLSNSDSTSDSPPPIPHADRRWRQLLATRSP